jgi:hypothetical protein
MGLQPSSTQLSHLLAAARASGELKQLPCMALRYTQLAAERGITSAAAALAYAYTTGMLCDLLGHKGICKWWFIPMFNWPLLLLPPINHTRSSQAI